MFNSLFADDTGHATSRREEEDSPEGNTSAGSSSAPGNPLLNLWSVATAVTNTVKARADELVKSVVDTDWRSELSQFSREVGEESKTLKEKTAELVEHLPEQVVHLPEKAEEALHQLPGQVHLPKDVGQTLEGVGVAFAQLGKTLLQGTKELIDELKDGVETEIAAASREGKRATRKAATSSASKMSAVQAKYSRFETEVAAMQRDSSTYCDEPEDAEEYARWRAEFNLDGVKADIARIVADNAFMAELQARLVPIIVEYDDFWHRYFYRLHKLQQKEDQRQQLAQRAKALQEDEVPLGWGDEDDTPLSPVEQGPAAPSDGPSQQLGSTEQTAISVQSRASESPEKSTPVVAEEATSPTATELNRSTPAAAAPAAEAPATPGADAAKAPASAAQAAPHLASAAIPVTLLTELLPTTDSPSQSGCGDSAASSAPVHVDADTAQNESEPHVESASDGSAKEWCVVSTESHPPSSSEEPLPVSVETPNLEAAATGPEASTVKSVSSAAVEVPDLPAAKAAGQATKPATMKTNSSVAKGADDEEVDEDWGNWD